MILNVLKIAFLLGFLIFIHEGGHFLVAKFFKINVTEFSIGFGKKLYSKKYKDTLYSLRCIPLGGFVNLLGENEKISQNGSFSEASIAKRIAVVSAGAIVNILFGIILYFILMICLCSNFKEAFMETVNFSGSIGYTLKMLFTGQVKIEQMTGPIGISEMVVEAKGWANYVYLLSGISLSLGVTNLLPVPALDGGRIVLLIIEGIRGKALKEEIEIKIQLIGFTLLILLSLYVSYKDVLKIVL